MLHSTNRKEAIVSELIDLETKIADAQNNRYDLKKELSQIRRKEIEESMNENTQQLLKG
jgi:NADH:ubiquinone oxidoreductase subunit B-like Fe-S oxidoreductase